MPIPLETVKVYEKTHIDLVIEEFAEIEKPTVSDMNKVIVQAYISDQLDQYRLDAIKLSEKTLREEGHSSKQLADLMAISDDSRPHVDCECHAMISGKHRLATPMRAIMAWCKMRIDDPRNGCWLPRHYDVVNNMPKWLRDAVPHQGLHNPRYYDWLDQKINIDLINGLSDLIDALKMVRLLLQTGKLPTAAWPKKK